MHNPSVTEIRSLGLTKVNRLVRAARQLDALRPAFIEWQAGEIYVCKKTGSYRYRFGANSKSPAPWSKVAQDLFESPAAFALAAVVLAPDAVSIVRSSNGAEQPDATARCRANIIQLAASSRVA